MLNIHSSTIEPMLDLIDCFNAGQDVTKDLSELLDHPDYKIEIERYQNHEAQIGFTKEDFMDVFLNIRSIKACNISSKALRYRLKDLKHIMDNTAHYRLVLNRIKEIDFSKSIKKAEYGLPDNQDDHPLHIIFSVGLGVSGGWAYKNYIHCDLNVIVDKRTDSGLINTIAHEIHHIGHSRLEVNLDMSPLSYFFYLLSIEGTAVKYCNNFQGLLTNKLNQEVEMSLHQQSYTYYLDNFESIYDQFKEDVNKLASGHVCAKDLFDKNYSYRDVIIKDELVENYLVQPIKYFFGADVWGIIHDVHGREALLACLEDPDLFLESYRHALKMKDLEKYMI